MWHGENAQQFKALVILQNPEFDSQYFHGGSQPYETPVLGALTQRHTKTDRQTRHIYTHKTPINIKYINIFINIICKNISHGH